jgi:hypothetical protein
VPSVRALGSWSDARPPSLSPGADCSRMALDMAAVSPLRSDSKTRNSLTDCSMDPPLPVGDAGDAGCWLLPPSLGTAVVDVDVDMAGGALGRSFFDRLRWWPVTGELSDACDELGGELFAVFVALPSADVDVPSVFDVPSFFDVTLLSMFLTLCDLERLCLRADVSDQSQAESQSQSQSQPQPDMCMSPAVAHHAGLEHSPFHGCCDWARRARVAGQEARPA